MRAIILWQNGCWPWAPLAFVCWVAMSRYLGSQDVSWAFKSNLKIFSSLNSICLLLQGLQPDGPSLGSPRGKESVQSDRMEPKPQAHLSLEKIWKDQKRKVSSSFSLDSFGQNEGSDKDVEHSGDQALGVSLWGQRAVPGWAQQPGVQSGGGQRNGEKKDIQERLDHVAVGFESMLDESSTRVGEKKIFCVYFDRYSCATGIQHARLMSGHTWTDQQTLVLKRKAMGSVGKLQSWRGQEDNLIIPDLLNLFIYTCLPFGYFWCADCIGRVCRLQRLSVNKPYWQLAWIESLFAQHCVLCKYHCIPASEERWAYKEHLLGKEPTCCGDQYLQQDFVKSYLAYKKELLNWKSALNPVLQKSAHSGYKALAADISSSSCNEVLHSKCICMSADRSCRRRCK